MKFKSTSVTKYLEDLSFDGGGSHRCLHDPTIPTFGISDNQIDTRYRPSVVAYDTEATGLDWSTGDRPFGLSVAYRDSQGLLRTAWYDWPVDPRTRKPQYHNAKGLNLFGSWYGDPNIEKVGANTKFDRHMIREAFGLEGKGTFHDVLIAAWCCNTLEPSYKLNDLAEKYLGIDQKDHKILRERTKKLRDYYNNRNYQIGPSHSTWGQDYWLSKFHNHNDNTCQTYGTKDAIRTLLLWEFYCDGLSELGNSTAYTTEIEAAQVIYRMEQVGIKFFKEKCEIELEQIKKQIEQLDFQVKLLVGNPTFNPNSSKQLAEILYNRFKLPILKRTPITEKGGGDNPSTDQSTLTELLKILSSNSIPLHLQSNEGVEAKKLIELLLQLAGFSTGKSYCENYIKYSSVDTYCTSRDYLSLEKYEPQAIHCTFNQLAADELLNNKTRTGRLSSSRPNLQNVADPSKSIGSKYVCDSRGFFGPRKGYTLYAIDYSGLELRIFAERCNGKLKEAFLSGRDPHNETREIVPYLSSMENKERGRKLAKHTNFTVVNCGGADVLEKKYGIPIEEGTIITKDLHDSLPEIRERQKQAEQFAIQHGYIETLFGRKINIDLSRNKYGRYLFAYRASPYDIQGSAADIIKRAMIQTHKFIKTLQDEGDLPPQSARLLLSIHDELVFEIRQDVTYRWFIKEIISIMEGVAKNVMEIPLKCEAVKSRKSWSSGDKKDVSFSSVQSKV